MKKKLIILLILVIILIVLLVLLLTTPKNNIEVQETDFPETTYIGIKEEITFDQMRDAATYETAYEEIMNYTTGNQIILSGPPVNIYFTWDEENELTTMGIAMPVMDVAEIDSQDLELITIGPSKALKAVHEGDYTKLYKAHLALEKYMIDNGYELNEIGMEEYITETDAEPLLTNVYLFVK